MDKKFGSGMYGQQRPKQNIQNGQFKSTSGGSFNSGFNNFSSNYNKPKKNGRFRLDRRIVRNISLGVLTLSLVFFGIWWKFLYTGLPAQPEYNLTARYTFDKTRTAMQAKGGLSTVTYKQQVSDAWLPKELDYYNGNKKYKSFMEKILKNTDFIFETKKMTSRQGKKVVITDTGINKPTVKVKVPDYKALEAQMEVVDTNAIKEVYTQRGITNKDYKYNEKMIDMYIDYILSFKDLPTKTVELPLTTSEVSDVKAAKKAGQPIYKVISDKKLDQILFSSTAFHDSETTFAAIATGTIGTTGVNPEYTAWQIRKTEYDKEQAALNKYDTDYKAYKKAKIEYDAAVTAQKESSSSSTSTSTPAPTQLPAKPVKPTKPQTPLLSYSRSDSELKHDRQLTLEKEVATQTKLVQDTPIEGVFRIRPNPALQTQVQDVNKAIADQNKKVVYVNGKPVYAGGDGVPSKNKELVKATKELQKQESIIGVEPRHEIPLREQIQNEEYLRWATLDPQVKVATPQPATTINKPLEDQAIIPFTWTGAYYLLNDYINLKGVHETIHPRWGNGSQEKPAAIGTPVDAKMLDNSGNAHDVRITLKKIYTEKKAIEYATSFDVRNRGFDNTASNKLVIIEYDVKNLEDRVNTLNGSYTLSDKYGNEIPRNGTMYSFRTRAKFNPQQTITMQDWFYTSDINNLYLTWSKNFNKRYPIYWFRVLGAKNAGGPMY